MAVLLQFWQDHMTKDLFGGHVCQASDLANMLIWDINPWLPHKAWFSWDYVATQAMLWLDVCEQFTEEHFREWEAQKSQPCQLGALEHDIEIIYHRHLTKRQAEMDAMNSREKAAKQLPPKQQATQEERRVQAMPVRRDIVLAGLENALYPNWARKQNTRPKGSDLARHYRIPKEDAEKQLTLEEELDAKSVFHPPASGSQSG